MQDFTLLKAFNVKINYLKDPSIKKVIWQPPYRDWMKVNYDGAYVYETNTSSCGGIFRNNFGELVLDESGVFSETES